MSTAHASIVCAALALGLLAPPVQAQDSQSAAAATALTALLDGQKMDAIAARDPEHTDRFIAALYFAGSQLLVIAATHPVPTLVEERLTARQFRDVYTDLHGAGAREGRIFVTDLQANGLRRTRDRGAPFDIVYRDGVHQASYDGDAAGQKLTQSAYNARFQKDDAEYARILKVLADALRAPATRP